MPHGVRLGRTLGVLAIIAGVIGLVALPFLTEVTLGSFPLLLVLLALLGGVLLVTAPTAFLQGIPPAALTAWAMINQAAFAWTTGDADSPFLPGFTVIVAAVAASSTVRLTVFAVALAAAGFLAIGLADVVLSAADMVRIVVDAVVLMTVGITVSRLAWRRRVAILEPAAVDGVERRFGGTLRVDVEGIGPVSASVGVAALPDAPDPHAVLRLADEEMYSRKASGAKRESRRASRRVTTAT